MVYTYILYYPKYILLNACPTCKPIVYAFEILQEVIAFFELKVKL